MGSHLSVVTSVFAALAMAAAPAALAAENCGNLTRINTVEIVNGPNRALVPVSINGVQKLFLLDTGGDISQVSRDLVQELKLPVRESRGVKMLDLYGNASRDQVMIEDFGLGRMKGKDIQMMVEPNPDFARGTRFSGLLAADLMGKYDVELDFGGNKLNYYSPDHCEGRVVYWQPSVIAVVPITLKYSHLVVPVTLDGHSLRAEIDTGSSNTNIGAGIAKRVFGLTAESPGAIPLQAAGMPGAFGHIFTGLAFEGVQVSNPRIAVLPDQFGKNDRDNTYQTGSLIKKVDDNVDPADMLIGMDVLKNLHIYMAFGERKLYISGANDTGVAADLTKAPQ